jgi:hypothetical protein
LTIPPSPAAIQYMIAPMTAAAGNVMAQAATMRPATDQRTVAPFLPMPTP